MNILVWEDIRKILDQELDTWEERGTMGTVHEINYEGLIIHIKEIDEFWKAELTLESADSISAQQVVGRINEHIKFMMHCVPDEPSKEVKSDTTDLSLLGNANTKYYYDKPNMNILETFENQHPDTDHCIHFICPEFTSLCPKTGQPDFATILINYIPKERCVESKSLKLYLFSYRNHGEFHEDCVNRIAKDLIALLDPKRLEVMGEFNVRGGIAIHPHVTYPDDFSSSWNPEDWRKQYVIEEEQR